MACLGLVALAGGSWPFSAHAQDDQEIAGRGAAFARQGQCHRAIPLLEQAEHIHHRPASATVLAECYVDVSKPAPAADLYEALAVEGNSGGKSPANVAARKMFDVLKSQVAFLLLRPSEAYPELELIIDGRPVQDPRGEARVDPNVRRSVVIRAKGYRPRFDEVVLRTGEHYVHPVRLVPSGGTPGPGPLPVPPAAPVLEPPRRLQPTPPPPQRVVAPPPLAAASRPPQVPPTPAQAAAASGRNPAPPPLLPPSHTPPSQPSGAPPAPAAEASRSRSLAPPPMAPKSDAPVDRPPHAAEPSPPRPITAGPATYSLGARYYGAILPVFWMNLAVDGGTNALFPGGAIYLTRTKGTTETTLSFGYMNLSLAQNPVKPHGAPDTDWEFISSSLQSVFAAVDVTWGVPLGDSGRWTFRYGGSVGVGYFVTGSLHRNQVYPKNGHPGDPWSYSLCRGPNNPWGTYQYCDAFDKDAAHYGNYAEPDWLHGGIVPAPYPWLVLPQLGLSWKLNRSAIVDLSTGLSIAGVLTSLGMRYDL